MNRLLLAAALAGTLTGATAGAATTGCPALGKAGQLAQAQARIHAASRSFTDGEPVSKETTTHSVVVGRMQTLLEGAHRSQTRLDMSDIPGAPANSGESMRTLAANLVYFNAEIPCKALGRDTVAGRGALAYEVRYEVDTGEAIAKVWLDAATGLPLKMVSRQKDFDLGLKLGKDGKLAGVQHKANHKTLVQQHAWLFGDAVKDIPRNGTAPDAATAARLDELLR